MALKDDWVPQFTPGHTAEDWTYTADAANAVAKAVNAILEILAVAPPLATKQFHIAEEFLHDAGADADNQFTDLGIPEASFRAVLTSGEAAALAARHTGLFYYAIPYDLVREVVEDDPLHTETRDDDYVTTMEGFVAAYGIDDMYLHFGAEFDNDPGNLYWAQNRFLEAGSDVNPNRPTSGMTRQEIYDQFMHFYTGNNHDANTNHHQLGQILSRPYTDRGYKTSCVNVYAGNVHFSAEMGVDQVMLETNNDDIPGIVGALGFVRGAGTQYGREWGIDMSHWRSYWPEGGGVTDYTGSTLISGWSNSNYRRHFYLTYFGGADTLFLEGVNLNLHGSVTYNGRSYTPLATEIKNFCDFSLTRHTARGVPHVPVAVMKDHIVSFGLRFGQWVQSRNVWYSQLTPNAGENMMHNLWDLIYPGYNNWGTSLTTAEPWGAGHWGEQFDVITERIAAGPLQSYPSVILAMNTALDATLQAKLATYAAAGGVVVINAKQLSGTAHESLTGVHLTGTGSTSNDITWDPDSEVISEPTFNYATCTLLSATNLAHSGTNTTQVATNTVGSGEVWTVMPDWMSNPGNDTALGIASKIIDVLTSRFAKMWITGVNHTSIDYAICTGAGVNGTTTVVMIANNHASTAWTGTLNFDGVRSPVREWIADADPSYTTNGGNTQVSAGVNAGDVKVYAVG